MKKTLSALFVAAMMVMTALLPTSCGQKNSAIDDYIAAQNAKQRNVSEGLKQVGVVREGNNVVHIFELDALNPRTQPLSVYRDKAEEVRTHIINEAIANCGKDEAPVYVALADEGCNIVYRYRLLNGSEPDSVEFTISPNDVVKIESAN